MQYLTIKPILGTKNNCPIDSMTLVQPLDKKGYIWATHDVGGQNFDLEREDDACSKAFGRAQYDAAANATKTRTLGLHELWDGTNRVHFHFDAGKVYQIDSGLEQDDVSDGNTFAVDAVDLYSIIQYGTYMVFADRAEHTPYKIDHDDGAVSMLIDAGTEFKFRYLLNFTNRIIGLYSTEANGDLDIRYTNALAGTTFPAANQLYKEGDSIAGAHVMGHNSAAVFGETDIYRMDYYPSGTQVFTLLRVLEGWGSVNHHCIVSDGIFLYFYDQQRGFCKFDGSSEPLVISQDYEGMISRIPATYNNLITSAWLPFTSELAWSIPVDNDTAPSKIIFYNTKTGQWRHENKVARYLDVWRHFTGITWTNLRVLTDDVWPSPRTWAYYTSESSHLVWGASNGHLYTSSSEGDDTADWDGYRIEPVLPFPGKGKNMTRLLEIWVGIAEKQAHSLDFYWRGADTVGELEQEAWTSLGALSMDSPDDPVLYTDQTARLNQIKWGTDLKSEPYSVNEIKLGYVIQGSY